MSWLQRLRQRNPGLPVRRILWWALVCRPIAFVFLLFYRHRWWGLENVPTSGPVLMICNHQSHIDLPAVGVGVYHRHFHPMAKKSLFDNPMFGWLIRSLNAFPVDTRKSDIKSLRTAIDLLKQGHLVLIFPEGQRTATGHIGPFQEGMMLLIRRAKPTILPAAIDGTWNIMPPGQPLPKLVGRSGAMYGTPIPAERLLDMAPDEAMQYLRCEVDKLRMQVRQRLRLGSRGRYPVTGPGDQSICSDEPAQASTGAPDELTDTDG
jgi:1-acyl-sn-glycerol-3-phosphate acyltransferase